MSLKKDLKKSLKGNDFSIMIDEWSDIHIHPHLAIIVIFFDNDENQIRQ